MNSVLTAYTLYISIAAGLTIYVGHTLHKRGRVFILESFNNDEVMTDSVNHLLLVGFYLLNLGFVCLFLKYGAPPTNATETFEYICTKEGVVLLSLGGMHFFNMYNIAKMRKKHLNKKLVTSVI
jgi:hypothetical protein